MTALALRPTDRGGSGSLELRTSPPTPRKTYARGTITRAAVAR